MNTTTIIIDGPFGQVEVHPPILYTHNKEWSYSEEYKLDFEAAVNERRIALTNASPEKLQAWVRKLVSRRADTFYWPGRMMAAWAAQDTTELIRLISEDFKYKIDLPFELDLTGDLARINYLNDKLYWWYYLAGSRCLCPYYDAYKIGVSAAKLLKCIENNGDFVKTFEDGNMPILAVGIANRFGSSRFEAPWIIREELEFFKE